MRFVVQLYCPADGATGNDAAFHRSLYVFACPRCCRRLGNVNCGGEATRERVRERVESKFQGGAFAYQVTSGRKSIHSNHLAKVYSDDPKMTMKLSNEIYGGLVEMGIIDRGDNDRLSGDPRQRADAVEAIWEKYDVTARGGGATATAADAGEEGDGGESEEAAAAAGTAADATALPFGITSSSMLRPLRDEEVADASSVWLVEELNVAWDEHEITSEGCFASSSSTARTLPLRDRKTTLCGLKRCRERMRMR